MDNGLKQELEWMNENLKAIVTDLNIMFCQIKEIEKKLKKEE